MRATVCLLLCIMTAQAAVINFEDGSIGAAVGATYAALGVTFTNARFESSFGTTEGLLAFGSFDVTHTYNYGYDNRVIATFSAPVDFVSILAGDLGEAGYQIDAYDASTGGNLIGSDSGFGIGLGIGNSETLSVSTPGIRRIELYQPNFNGVDSIAADLLTFSPDPVPEPSTYLMMGAGLAAMAWYRHRRARR